MGAHNQARVTGSKMATLGSDILQEIWLHLHVSRHHVAFGEKSEADSILSVAIYAFYA